MASFIEFLTQQWQLVGALAVVLILLMRHESKKSGDSLTPQQAINKVNKEGAVIVDVRDSAEFKQGHIVDALNIPHAKFNDRVSELDAYQERPVILVCKIGQHAGAAGKVLNAKGFKDVYRLSGGLSEWKAAQLPLVK